MQDNKNIIKIVGLILLIIVIIIVGIKLFDMIKRPDEKILGTWTMTTESTKSYTKDIKYTFTIEFYKDGKCVVTDKTPVSKKEDEEEKYENKSGTYTYYITDKSITLESSKKNKESIVYSYKFDGDNLLLTENKINYTFVKEK